MSEAYWRQVWGNRMKRYESIRDGLHGAPSSYGHLDAEQLFKHAFALRTAVHKRPEFRALAPILFYVHAEPNFWSRSGDLVDEGAKTRHREEIERFAAAVADGAVLSVRYRQAAIGRDAAEAAPGAMHPSGPTWIPVGIPRLLL